MGRAIRKIKPPTYVKCPEGAGNPTGSRFGPHEGGVYKVDEIYDWSDTFGWAFKAILTPDRDTQLCLTHSCAFLRVKGKEFSWIYCDKNGRPRDRQPEAGNPLG